ncbi:MAG: uracil-DNA glycosylase [Clostridiales bacterium]|nr:uracil-DNA glycosylase [Clostridiales bacterium]
MACKTCNRCCLSTTRNNVVFGRGNKDARILIIGEGPGADEDMKGEPFVGRAGKLLDNLLCAVGISQDEIYIANIVKCRPPQNRVPTQEEARICINYLRNQVYLQKPNIIVCLGNTASRYVLECEVKITEMRGKWIEKKNVLIMPTFHPAALLRDGSKKIPMFEDLKKVRDKIIELKEGKNI